MSEDLETVCAIGRAYGRTPPNCRIWNPIPSSRGVDPLTTPPHRRCACLHAALRLFQIPEN